MKIEFEGPSLALKIYTAKTPAGLVKAHALDAGPPFLPPKWMYGTWRWRDEVTERKNYYDGTPVTGPFNSEFMEDVLLMKAYGIPLGIYWVDRPWGPGKNGYDDFEIDTTGCQTSPASIKWLNEQNVQMFLWIGPFFQGQMETNVTRRGLDAGQRRTETGGRQLSAVRFHQSRRQKILAGWRRQIAEDGRGRIQAGPFRKNIPESGTRQGLRWP